MNFKTQTQEGVFLKRYKRFFAEVQIGEQIVIAHVPNSGSMKGCQIPGAACRVTYNPDPSRKLHYTLEMIKTPSSWVGVNTSHPNKLVMELWQSKKFAPWIPWDRAQGEVKVSEKSRIDFVFWNSGECAEVHLKKFDFQQSRSRFHFVEVKNVSLAENEVALFPDSVTERGQKHLLELMELKKRGHSTEILFTIQRHDTKRFSPADAIDPEYGRLLREAIKCGVQATALVCQLTHEKIELVPSPLPLVL